MDRAGKGLETELETEDENELNVTDLENEEKSEKENKLDLNELEHEVDNEQLEYKLGIDELFKDDESDEQEEQARFGRVVRTR